MAAKLEDIFLLSENDLVKELIKYNNKLKSKQDLKPNSLSYNQLLLINYYNYNSLFNSDDQKLTKNIPFHIIDKMKDKNASYFRLLLKDLYHRSNNQFNIADFKTIKINTQFLYHTTLIYNEETKEDWEEKYNEGNGAPYPEFGSYHTCYDHAKYFTITPLANYGNDKKKNVFLCYKLKSDNILKLLDIRDDYDGSCFFHHNSTEFLNREEILEKSGFDGYIGMEDSHEIFLFHPENFIESFEKIDFVDSDLPLDVINKEAFSELVVL